MPLTHAQVAGHQVEIGFQQGEIMGVGKTVHTEISSSGGGGYVHQGTGFVSAPQVQSRVVRRQEFWLRRDDGSEHAYQFQDIDIPMRDGQRACVISMRNTENGRSTAAVVHIYPASRWWSLQTANAVRKALDIEEIQWMPAALLVGAYLVGTQFAFVSTVVLFYGLFRVGRRIMKIVTANREITQALAEAVRAIPASTASSPTPVGAA